jgi:hypothetical protein
LLKPSRSHHTVIHGYVQSAATVASNTRALKDKLSDIANLHYVDGPPMRNAPQSSSRPWWILDNYLEHDMRASDRWNDSVRFHLTTAPWFDAMRLTRHNQVKWWSEELSKNQYDGIIGLSQGAAMTALLVSMVSTEFPFTKFMNIPPLWGMSLTEASMRFVCAAQSSRKGSRLPR